jgi:hypothetical protein
MKNGVNVPSKNNKEKNYESGSISQRYGSADSDPDPYTNFIDPQHWFCRNSDTVRSPFLDKTGRPFESLVLKCMFLPIFSY